MHIFYKFCAFTLCLSYVITMFLLVSCMDTHILSCQGLCTVNPQNSKQKPITKNFAGLHNHFPPLTMLLTYFLFFSLFFFIFFFLSFSPFFFLFFFFSFLLSFLFCLFFFLYVCTFFFSFSLFIFHFLTSCYI